MSDWWSQRLGGAPAARQEPPGVPQYTPQPQTFVGRDGQTYQMVPVGQQPQQYSQQQQPMGAPKVTMHNLIESMAHWSGGEGARSNHRCPGCGSPAVYERGMQVAPQCYECGWNPRFGPQGQPRG